MLSEGIRMFSEGISMLSEGLSMLSEGISMLREGISMLSEGISMLSEGISMLSEGIRMLSEGIRMLSEGIRMLSEGIRMLSEGIRMLSEGIRMLSEGIRMLSEGIRMLSEGIRMLSEGIRMLSEGIRMLSEGIRMLSEGIRMLSEGIHMLSGGIRMLSEGIRTLSEGIRMLSEGIRMLCPYIGTFVIYWTSRGVWTKRLYCIAFDTITITSDLDSLGIPTIVSLSLWLGFRKISSGLVGARMFRTGPFVGAGMFRTGSSLNAGDFNAKIGGVKEGDDYTCLAKFSKSKRNNNGQTLLELCEEKKLFVSNSAFNHPSRHQTTWTLNQKRFENPKVEDSEGKLATRPEDILCIVSTHFEDKFVDKEEDIIPPFQGTAKPLIKEITAEETAFKQRPSRDHKPSTGSETLEGINITDREGCRSDTDEELGRDTAISQWLCGSGSGESCCSGGGSGESCCSGGGDGGGDHLKD
ncbi:hypothetical protein EGW08_018561 [Elysia chlorotica]|uniref:Uncharacterized protein n=1 Tax=Elysia chlorotica TaxID=188477 RepID=A0A433SWN7_ELYCH|nr:hypothetical protein EGW08_018561 [Elysia chlorotica]